MLDNQTRQITSASINLEADVTDLSLEIGATATINFTISNKSAVVDGFGLTVRNLDPAWYTFSEERVALFPDDSLPVVLELHPWAGATPLAGVYTFQVVATSYENPSAKEASVTIRLYVAGKSDISLKLKPERIVARKGAFVLTLSNAGTSECPLVLCPSDQEGLLVFAFDQARVAASKEREKRELGDGVSTGVAVVAISSPDGQLPDYGKVNTVWAPPGATANQGYLELTVPPLSYVTIPLHVRTRRRIWRGMTNNIRFELQARPPGLTWEEFDVVRIWGELAYKPYLWWLVNLQPLLRRAQMIAIWLVILALLILIYTRASIEEARADQLQVVAGQPTDLKWEARFAQSYTLDKTPVPNGGDGKITVNPGDSHIYSLCVSNVASVVTGKDCRMIPIMVLQPTPSPVPPTSTPTTTPTVVPTEIPTVPAVSLVLAATDTPAPAAATPTLTPTNPPVANTLAPTPLGQKPTPTPAPQKPQASPTNELKSKSPPTSTLPPPPTNTPVPPPTNTPIPARPPTNTPVAMPPLVDPYGASGAMRWPDWGTFDQPAKVMLDSGGRWVMEDFAMYLIEPQEGQFEWTATDRIVEALKQQGVNIVGIVSYSASWATPSQADDAKPNEVSFYPPDPGKYDAFVRALVGRYKDRVHYWQVWNEPNNDIFWKPRPNATEYAAVLKTAYAAIKATDPGAKVLSAGMSGNAVPFLEEMVAAGAGNSFDIFAMHPYAVPHDEGQGKVQSRPEVHKIVEVELTKYRAFLQRHNYNRPIWVTEVGWPARNWQLNEQDQADYLAQAYAQMLASGLVERIFWYSFKDASDNNKDSWGLVAWGGGKTDLSPKRPAYTAYAVSARMLGGAGTRPAGRLQLGPYQVIEDFEVPATWVRSFNPNGSFTITNEQHHGGASSGRIQYNFTGLNQAVDFAPPQAVPIPGRPTRFGLWIRGDVSGNYLSAWISDRDGELFKVRLGAVTGASDGWRYYEARINNYYFGSLGEYTGGNPANHLVDYPIKFTTFRLENTPDEPAGSGTIYVDELQTSDGPDASAVRFVRQDGQVVDVLWSVDPVQVNLSTSSANAQVTDRDGAGSNVNASGGKLPLSVSSSPVYVVHRP